MTLLLCDLDDTLVDRGRIVGLWAADFVRARRLSDEDLAWIEVFDDGGLTPREDFFTGLKTRFGLREAVADLVAEWRVVFPALYRCEAGVRDGLIEARAQGWTLGVVTNGDDTVQARKLAASGLDSLVDAVCISGDLGIRKPDRRIFALAAERAGVSITDGWMIGDNPVADIGGGRDAGLRTVWLSRGRAWPLSGFDPDHQEADPVTAIRRVLGARPSDW